MSDRSGEADRSNLTRGLSVLMLALGGGVLGAVLGNSMAPDSEVAMAISCAMLPLALLSGLGLWLTAALWLGILRLLGSVFVARWREPWEKDKRFVPPGSVLVLATSTAYSIGAAIVVSAVSVKATLVSTLALFMVVGVLYGVVGWRLARSGFLRPME